MFTIENFGPRTIYLTRYFRLIESQAQPKKIKGDYLERHHIYPECIFGENKQLVILTLRAHTLAHELIWRHYKKLNSKHQYQLGGVLARITGKTKNQFDTEGRTWSSRQVAVTRAAMHEAMACENNTLYGRKHTEETKENIRQNSTGRKHTEEAKIKIGKKTAEQWQNPVYRAFMIKVTSERVWKDTSREKLSIAGTGRLHSEETKKKIGASNKGKLLGLKKPPEFGANISAKLKGRKKTPEHVDKINRNPEKIRKTAEKNRGQKRTQETCDNISKSRMGSPAQNKGLISIFNPETNERVWINKDEVVPIGFIRGNPNGKGRAGGAGKKWWYDPIEKVKGCFLPGEEPLGWLPGSPSWIKK